MTAYFAPMNSSNTSFVFSRSQKAFLLTLVLYLCLAGVGYLSLNHFHNNKQTTNNLKQVAISASMFSVPTPKKIEPKVKPKAEPVKPPVKKPHLKKVVKPIKKPVKKPIKKIVEKPKPIKKVVTPTPVKPVKQEKVVKPEIQKTEVKPVTEPVAKAPVTEPKTKPTAKPHVATISQAAQARAEASYTSELQDALTQYAQNTYPFMAKRRNWEGKVQISFTIHRNGDITNVRVTEPDMRNIFNEAAMSIFTEEMQMHFKPFPKEITRDTWELSVPISYFLR
ncbi:energy transducer TonB [Hydrogenovibrio kuenenii]|uniref:energy transducer TonB n=1 Tax=Hydrogenovibrio kuenenii TaxID=63658 RepID=UPI000463ED4D|nr:energy transducer TonB [Hydrogenovibrio kuenenii]